jgi:hypothetical protein
MMEHPARDRGARKRGDFQWFDRWFGIYRTGFGPHLEVRPADRRKDRVRSVILALSLLPLLVLLFVALDWKPDAGQAHYEAATFALSRGDYQTGISELRQAVERSPGCLRYRFRLAWELTKHMMVTQAAGQLARVVPNRPGFTGFVLIAGFLFYYGGMMLSLYWRATTIRNSRPKSGL